MSAVEQSAASPEDAAEQSASSPGGDDARGEQAHNEPVNWDQLPGAVRGRLVELAANALGDMPKTEVPQRLRAVARFAPAKRARVAAATLLGALKDNGSFRAWVAQWGRQHRPHALDEDSADAVDAAVAAVLLGAPNTPARLRVVAEHAELTGLRAERDAALSRIERLEVELERVRAERDAAVDAKGSVHSERDAELERLRARLREQGVELRNARDAERLARDELAGAGSDTAGQLAEVTARLDRERQRADAERSRAERALAGMDQARRAAREAREGDEVRLALLLDTVERAAGGLRAELGVGPAGTVGTGARPADTVPGASQGGRAPASVSDAVALDRLLALPNAHLIVDGYNVTKTGYPELPLADQRDRLTRQLSALAARTAAEVTVVFDGAAVVAIPSASMPGVRVLFSDPGVLADDVIRALVAAEPEGRPLVVATSDREVIGSVRGRGAYSVPSAVLLTRIGRV